MTRKIARRILAGLVLVTFSCTVGCATYREVPSQDITSGEAADLVGKDVKLYTGERMVTMLVDRVEYPFVVGTRPGSDDPTEIRVDLRKLSKIEVHDPNREGRRFVATFIVVGALAAVVMTTFEFPD